MKLLKPRLVGPILLVMALVPALWGCDLGAILGYRGPQPAPEGIEAEAGVVRELWRDPSGGTLSMTIERSRFAAARDPRNINRVIDARVPQQLAAEVESLALRPGDRVIISTEFIGISEGVGSMQVPNWPPTGALEYPIGRHRLTSLARIQ